MFGFTQAERLLFERLLAEKDRTIQVLADVVDWHRAAAGTVIGATPYQPPASEDEAWAKVLAELDPGLVPAAHMSEEEEELEWLVKNGQLSPEAAAVALQQSQGSAELPFDFDE